MFILVLKTKNKLTIKNFLLQFKQVFENAVIKIACQKTAITKFSILKSPHVNKNAQYQLGFKNYKIKLKLVPINIEPMQIIFKTVIYKLFFDLRVKLNFSKINANLTNNIVLNNYKQKTTTTTSPINKKTTNCKIKLKKTVNYLTILNFKTLKTVKNSFLEQKLT